MADIKNVVERIVGYKDGNTFVPVTTDSPLPTSSTVSDIQIGVLDSTGNTKFNSNCSYTPNTTGNRK